MPSQTQQALIFAQAALNDQAGSIWNATNMLPFVQLAFIDLQLEVTARGLPIIREVSALISVAVNTLNLGAQLPSDFVLPIKIKEKAVGESAFNYVDMTQVDFIPDYIQSEILRYWSWGLNSSLKKNDIFLLGATTIRNIKLFYKAGLVMPAVIDSSTNLYINNAESFVGIQAASYAASSVGNDTWGMELKENAQPRLELINIAATKQQQSLPARRKPYRRSGRTILT